MYVCTLISISKDLQCKIHDEQVDAIAHDWLASNLYWVDSNFNWIMMLSLLNSISTTIINSELDTPIGLAVNPSLRLAKMCGNIILYL